MGTEANAIHREPWNKGKITTASCAAATSLASKSGTSATATKWQPEPW